MWSVFSQKIMAYENKNNWCEMYFQMLYQSRKNKFLWVKIKFGRMLTTKTENLKYLPQIIGTRV